MLTLNYEPIARPPGTALMADLYCGAGGSGEGVLKAFKALNRKVYGTFLNHWKKAIEIHVANHPDHRHFLNSVYTVKPEDIFERGEHLDVLWASPECIYHSNARGGKPLDDQSRSGGWVVHKWIHKTMPDFVFVENVPEMRGWCPCIQDKDKYGNLLWVHVIPLKGRTRTKRIVTTHVPFDPYPDEFEQLYWRRLKKVGYEPALKADKSRKGETFNRWFKAFDKQGYDAEYRILCAADYGVPTSRRRFILVAVRRGIGKKVVWPDATHSKPDENGKPRMGTQLWRTARECIDLTNKGQSIYARKHELADKTMFRYWLGFLRYGMKDFIVPQHQGWDGENVRSLDQPFGTITADHRGEMVGQSYLVQMQGQSTCHFIDAPINTILSMPKHYLAQPYLLKLKGTGTARPVDEPIDTISAGGERGGVHFAYVQSWLQAVDQHGSNGSCTSSMDRPLGTIVTKQNQCFSTVMLHPCIVQAGHSPKANTDEAVRVKSIDQPLGTIHAGGGMYMLCQTGAYLVPNFGENGNRGDAALTTSSFKYLHPTDPVTVPAQGGLIKLPNGQVLEEAIMQALGPKGYTLERVEKMLAPLVKMLHERPDLAEINKRLKPWIYTYYSSGSVGQSIDEPLPTIRTKEGCALAMAGIEYDGCNFLMENWFRMVDANELALCQGFPSWSYSWYGEGWLTPSNASAASVPSPLPTSQDLHKESPGKPVDLHAQIDCVRRVLVLRSRGKLSSHAPTVENKEEFPLPTEIADSAQQLADMLRERGPITGTGKEVSQKSTSNSISPRPGKKYENLSGNAKGDVVNGVGNTACLRLQLKTGPDITSEAGANSLNYVSILETLCCFVTRVIDSCIQGKTKTQIENSFRVRLELKDSYKFPGNKTDQVRAIGNSVPPGMCFALTYAALTQNPYIPPKVWMEETL